ncbi:MAG: DUF998 domain-containing protein [Caldilineaceae bacterium]|nr:DUF998 domain-containing protein [Caldilineaceae bacterium]
MQMKSESQINIPNHSPQTVLQQPQRLSMLASLAIVGQVFLLASAWLLPVVSEYSLVSDNISEMVLGRYGFVQTIAFVIAGLGTLALAYAIRKLTRGTWGSATGSLLVAVYGVGAILSAIFPTDRIDSQADTLSLSTIGMIHVIVALISFLCIIVGMFVLTRTFALKAQWRSLMIWSGLCASGALALFFVQSEGPWVGIMQRLFVLMASAWMILVAIRVRSLAASGERDIPS